MHFIPCWQQFSFFFFCLRVVESVSSRFTKRDMKTNFNIFIILCIMTMLVGCNKEDDSADNTAKFEYFECKINGEFFRAVSDFTCSGTRWDYYPKPYQDLPAGAASFTGRDCSTDITLSIGMHGLEHQTGQINFLEPSFADSVFPVYISDFVIYKNLVSGSMIINQFEPRENGSGPLGWIQGTFELVVTDDNSSDTIRVTEGRFGFDVPQIF